MTPIGVCVRAEEVVREWVQHKEQKYLVVSWNQTLSTHGDSKVAGAGLDTDFTFQVQLRVH